MTNDNDKKQTQRKRAATTVLHTGKRIGLVIETGSDSLNRPVEYLRILPGETVKSDGKLPPDFEVTSDE